MIAESFPVSDFRSIESALRMEGSLLEERKCQSNEPDEVRIWATRRALVAPFSYHKKHRFAQAVRVSAERGWPVAVRKSGGGVTPQGPGILNVSLGLMTCPRRPVSINQAYELLTRPIIEALADLGIVADCKPVPDSFCDGRFNIAVGDRKLVGTAQRRTAVSQERQQSGILAHALILFDVDAEATSSAINDFQEFLGEPSDFRATAQTSISELLGEVGREMSLASFASELHRRYRVSLDERFLPNRDRPTALSNAVLPCESTSADNGRSSTEHRDHCSSASTNRSAPIELTRAKRGEGAHYV